MTLICHSFVDRDMFLRYTDLGVGHPATLRRIVRDCFSPQTRRVSEAIDVDERGNDGHEEEEDEQGMCVDVADEESGDECEEEDSDDGFDSDSLGEEVEGDLGAEDEDDLGEEDEDDLSF